MLDFGALAHSKTLGETLKGFASSTEHNYFTHPFTRAFMPNPSKDAEVVLASAILRTFPRAEFLQLVKTLDQFHHWLRLRYHQYLVSRCFLALHKGWDDPLAPPLESGQLSHEDYQMAWSITRLYWRIWELVQLSERFVRKQFDIAQVAYPFSCALDLFAQILAEDIDSTFSICLKPYKEMSSEKLVKVYRAMAKARRGEALSFGEQYQLDKLEALFKDRPRRQWLCFLVAVAQRHSKGSRGRLLKSALEDFHKAMADVCDVQATDWRKSGSFRWNNGVVSKGKPGGYR